MVRRKQSYRFENDWPAEDLEYIGENYEAGRTIPVDVGIEAEHHVLNMENVKRILSSAHTISVMDCGLCVDRCQFGARELVHGSLSIDQDPCFGSGLCVSSCPTYAITLVARQ